MVVASLAWANTEHFNTTELHIKTNAIQANKHKILFLINVATRVSISSSNYLDYVYVWYTSR